MPLRMPALLRPAVARRLGLVLAVVAAAALAGCKPTPGISKYTAPHEADNAPPVDPPEDPSAGERILGIIAPATGPQPQQWWFFKLRGRPQAIARREKPLEQFAGTLMLPAAEEKLPTYKLPPGWEVVKKSNEMALFSVRTGNPYTPHNLDVSQAGGTLASNVNRWRGQVGLPELPEDKVEESLRKIKLADGTQAYWVDLTGPGGKGGMKPPFMKP
jgi:hypothetical protein